MTTHLRLPNGTLIEDVENTFITREIDDTSLLVIRRANGELGYVLARVEDPDWVGVHAMEYAYHELQRRARERDLFTVEWKTLEYMAMNSE